MQTNWWKKQTRVQTGVCELWFSTVVAVDKA